MANQPLELPSWASQSVQDDFVAMIELLRSEQEIQLFLEAFLTDRELFLIACRMRIAWLLFAGFNTQQARKLSQHNPNISSGVITRANKAIVQSKKARYYKVFFRRFKKHRLNSLSDLRKS